MPTRDVYSFRITLHIVFRPTLSSVRLEFDLDPRDDTGLFHIS
jgi:hypothetical protein